MFEVHHIKVMERSKNVWVFGGLKVVNPIYKKHITTTTTTTTTTTPPTAATATATTTTTCLKSNSPICGKAVQHLQTRFARQEDAQVRQGVRWAKTATWTPPCRPRRRLPQVTWMHMVTGGPDGGHAERWGLGVFELLLVEDI